MSITLEELKKIINEQEAALLIKAKQQPLSLMEQQVFEKLQMRLIDEEGVKELPSVDILQKMYKQTTNSFKIQSASDASIATIFANFEREFGKENIQDNSLHFPDDPHNSKANDFFQSQANDGHDFLFKQGNLDNYAFSDGKGHYKMSTEADIISYCKKNLIELPQQFNKTPDENDELSPSIMRQG